MSSLYREMELSSRVKKLVAIKWVRSQRKMKKQDSVLDDMMGGGFGGEDDVGESSGGRVRFGGLDPVEDNG